MIGNRTGGGGGRGQGVHGRRESNSVSSTSSGGGGGGGGGAGGSSGGGLLSRTMSSFWRPRATKQNDNSSSGRADSVASSVATTTTSHSTSHSDTTSRLTSDISERSSLAEPPPGMMWGGEKERTHALVTMADVSSRGQLMAMEERHDVLR